jgi:chloramphenicol-sensitive protein RarD
MAFGLWGILPVYWKALAHLGSDLALAHRVVWTLLMVLPLLAYTGELRSVMQAMKNPQVLRTHALAAALLGVNWGVFVWAAQHGRIVECSVGYFINPLLNVLIGTQLLGERLNALQKASISCATAGVLLRVAGQSSGLWIALSLALSFASYGLVRRQSSLGALSGLAVESVIGFPFALGYLVWSQQQGHPLWGTGSTQDLLLILGLGAITAVPLLGFAHAARKLPFSLLGLLQFLAPTGQFLLGMLVYGESQSPLAIASLCLIWLGVLLFCVELARRR